MKVSIELSDNQIAEFLQETVKMCMTSNVPRQGPLKPQHLSNLVDAIETCRAMNIVIEYFGGVPVNLTKIDS